MVMTTMTYLEVREDMESGLLLSRGSVPTGGRCCGRLHTVIIIIMSIILIILVVLFVLIMHHSEGMYYSTIEASLVPSYAHCHHTQ